jgi:hypothetical protein
MNQSPMKGWKSYLLWEGIPFWMLFLCFGFISLINWTYESKLITLNARMPDWVGSHMGLILLGGALGMSFIASGTLFLIRITRPKTKSDWYMFIALTLVAIFWIFPSLNIIIIGPAGITMMESLQQVPGK